MLLALQAHSDVRGDAFALARKSLESNIHVVKAGGETQEYLLAGGHAYHNIWTRDFAMSALGAMEIGRQKTVLDTAELLFSLQKADGQIPRIAENHGYFIRAFLSQFGFDLGFDPPFYGNFTTENGIIAIDGNAMLPWIAGLYVTRFSDRVAGARWWPKAKLALEYLERNYFVDGLVGKQPPFSDWEDSVARTGRVADTNEFYILALRQMAQWALFMGNGPEAGLYAAKAQEAQKKFLAYFWDAAGKKIRSFDTDDHLTADANLVAVDYDLVSKLEATEIMSTLRASPLWKPMPGRATFPEYPRSLKSRVPPLAGVGDYHDKMVWLWLTGAAAIAEREMGNAAACEAILNSFADLLLAYKDTYEVYDLRADGKLHPVKRIFYNAEVPFSWNAAWYIYADKLGCSVKSARP